MKGDGMAGGVSEPRSTAVEVEHAGTDAEAARRDAIFARRAEALARPPEERERGDALEALVFRLGDECYAFRTEQVVEVRPMNQLTPLPTAPAFVAGLVNVRGRIVPVVDPRPLFGLPALPDAVRAVILVSSSRGTVGLLATDRPEVRRLENPGLTGLPAEAPPGLDPAYVRGVTPDMVVVLDAERLLTDPRLVVQEDTR